MMRHNVYTPLDKEKGDRIAYAIASEGLDYTVMCGHSAPNGTKLEELFNNYIQAANEIVSHLKEQGFNPGEEV